MFDLPPAEPPGALYYEGIRGDYAETAVLSERLVRSGFSRFIFGRLDAADSGGIAEVPPLGPEAVIPSATRHSDEVNVRFGSVRAVGVDA
jgi:hypothetical protein